MECPGPGDNPNEIYCCGFGDNKFCCENVLTLDDEDINNIIEQWVSIFVILCII